MAIGIGKYDEEWSGSWVDSHEITYEEAEKRINEKLLMQGFPVLAEMKEIFKKEHPEFFL